MMADVNETNSTACSNLNEDYLLEINILRISTASISTLSCSVAIISLATLMCRRSNGHISQWDTSNHRLILCFLVAAFLYSFATVFQWVRLFYNSDNPLSVIGCEVVAFFVEYFSWTLILITLFMIFKLLFTVYQWPCSKKIKDSQIYSTVSLCFKTKNCECIVYSSATFLIPLMFVWIPFLPSIQGYGVSGEWCWIKVCDQNGNRYVTGYFLQAFLWYMSVLVLMGIIVCLIIAIVCRLRSKLCTKEALIVLPLLLYPIVFLLVNIIAFANRLTVLSTGDVVPALSFIHGLVDPLWGLLASLVLLFYCLIIRKQEKSLPNYVNIGLSNVDHEDGEVNMYTSTKCRPEDGVSDRSLDVTV